jgi:hypothetical protein
MGVLMATATMAVVMNRGSQTKSKRFFKGK